MMYWANNLASHSLLYCYLYIYPHTKNKYLHKVIIKQPIGIVRYPGVAKGLYVASPSGSSISCILPNFFKFYPVVTSQFFESRKVSSVMLLNFQLCCTTLQIHLRLLFYYSPYCCACFSIKLSLSFCVSLFFFSLILLF